MGYGLQRDKGNCAARASLSIQSTRDDSSLAGPYYLILH